MAEDAAATPAKKGINLVLILVPVAVIAALVLIFALPVTHRMLVSGPLRPLFARVGLAGPPDAVKGSVTAAPADPAAEVKRLGLLLETERKAQADRDVKIAQLQTQLAQAQATPAADDASAAPSPKPSPTEASDDVKRVAAYWAGMDAEKAADIAKALPDTYVKTVFRQMPADAVADIMNALPAKTAAKLTAGSPGDQP